MPYVKGVGYVNKAGRVVRYYIRKSEQDGFVHGLTKHGRYAGREKNGKYIRKSEQPGFIHGNTKPPELRTNGWKIMALNRDNYRCRECGSTHHLSVHHINLNGNHLPGPTDNTLDNLITLCAFCHFARHYGFPSTRVQEIWLLRFCGLTLQEIGNIFGISRQRVDQLTTKYGTLLGLRFKGWHGEIISGTNEGAHCAFRDRTLVA